MSQIRVVKNIQASKESVFNTVADVQNFRKVVTDIIDVEFLSETRVGEGTRFIETRQMGKRKASTDRKTSLRMRA